VQITGLGNDGLTKGQKVSLQSSEVPAQVKTVLQGTTSLVPYMYNGVLYWANADVVATATGSYAYHDWYRLKNTDEDKGGGAANILNYFKEKLRSYKTGGVADFTGPAWLDGTPSRPEYILNAKQTERFFTLVDVLDGFKDKDVSGGKSGDNYFEIEINVEKLENDYDVEKIATKIRNMIYEDATYRNVNAINQKR
jgi:hypothetical protein